MAVKVSVIIPVYNLENYIRTAVESVLEGSFQDYEILLIDDGSTDGTLGVCRELEAADSRIRVFTKENGGVGSARNYGLDRAEGEFVAFIDGDDLVTENYLERLVSTMEEDHLDWVICGWQWSEEHSEATRYVAFHRDTRIIAGDDEEKMIEAVLRGEGFSGIPSNCMGLYRRSLIENHHLRVPEDLRRGEDLVFNYSLAHYIRRFQFLKEPMYICRYREEASLGTMIAGDPIGEVLGLLEALDRERQRYGDRWTYGGLRFLYAKVYKIFIHIIVAEEDGKSRKEMIRRVDRALHGGSLSKLWEKIRWQHGRRRDKLKSFVWYVCLKMRWYSAAVSIWRIVSGRQNDESQRNYTGL